MLENVGRLTVEHDDGTRVVAENVAQLTIDPGDGGAEAVRNGSRTSAAQAEERGFDSRPPLQLYDFAAAGRHGNHRRWDRPDPACARCAAEAGDRPDIAPRSPRYRPDRLGDRQAMDSRSDRPDRPDIAPIHRSNERENFVRSTPPPTSPSSAAALIDLDLPDVRVLRRKWSRGGRREAHLKPADLARLDAIAACPEHDRAWSAAVLDGASGRDLIGSLERQHRELHAPGPVDPVVQTEALEAERRRQSYALRHQLDAGVDEVGRPLTEIARRAVERQLTRLERPEQAQGP